VEYFAGVKNESNGKDALTPGGRCFARSWTLRV
jgi:hypothetical protein